jgi:hypothetical protein
METTLRLLLMLSQKLASARREVALVEALPLILAATGSAFGAAYLKQGDALVLAAQSGMPAQLRCLVERLGLLAPPCFIAQRAAESRELTLDRDLRACKDRALVGALSEAGWAEAAACPLTAGGDLHGVLLIAAPVGQEISPIALTALELGGNTLALHLALLVRARADIVDADTARMAPIAAAA